MSIASPKTDKEYEARWDAETLANAENIKADKPRLSAAQAAARAIVDERAKDAQSMQKVAGTKSNLNNQGISGRNYSRTGPQDGTGPKGTNTNKGARGRTRKSGQGSGQGNTQGFNVFKRI